MRRIAIAGLALLAAAQVAGAQDQRERQPRAFEWTGRIPSGSWLRVKNLNGAIRVAPASGDQVEVVAEKSWRRADPEDVRFEVQRDGDNVTICALWYEESSCDAENYRTKSSGRRSGDISVEFTVRLPAGVKVDLRSVNGSLDIRDASSDVVARTVNGGIDVNTAAGPVTAKTVNGGIDVRMQALRGAGDMSFTTVNGSVKVALPTQLDADIDISTVNGRIHSDFPLTVSGRISPRQLRARIGQGGREITFKTVNGSVELLRAR